MKNKRRKINIQKEIQELRECFGDVKRFTDVHYRIRGELDIWPTTGRFYGIKTRMKGFYNTKLDLMDQIEYSEKVETPLQQTNAECEAQRLLFRDF